MNTNSRRIENLDKKSIFIYLFYPLQIGGNFQLKKILI